MRGSIGVRRSQPEYGGCKENLNLGNGYRFGGSNHLQRKCAIGKSKAEFGVGSLMQVKPAVRQRCGFGLTFLASSDDDDGSVQDRRLKSFTKRK